MKKLFLASLLCLSSLTYAADVSDGIRVCINRGNSVVAYHLDSIADKVRVVENYQGEEIEGLQKGKRTYYIRMMSFTGVGFVPERVYMNTLNDKYAEQGEGNDLVKPNTDLGRTFVVTQSEVEKDILLNAINSHGRFACVSGSKAISGKRVGLENPMKAAVVATDVREFNCPNPLGPDSREKERDSLFGPVSAICVLDALNI